MKITVTQFKNRPGAYLRIAHGLKRTTHNYASVEIANEKAEACRTLLEHFGPDEVLRRFREMKQAAGKDIPRQPNAPKVVPTLRHYGEKIWLPSLPGSVKYTTLKSYQLNVKYLVSGTAKLGESDKAALGDLPIDQIDYDRMETFLLHMLGTTTRRGETFSKDSLRLMVATARRLFNHAIRKKFILVNPTKGLSDLYRRARVERAKIHPFALEEMYRIEESAALVSLLFSALILTLSRTGMRIGEACGLQWPDLDFKHNVISISRNLPSSGNGDPTEPKTKFSFRTIPMSLELRPLLLSLSRKRKRGVPWVFPNSRGTPFDYSVFLNMWHNVQKAAKVEIRNPHQIRHFFATDLISRGENIVKVSRTLGHSSIDVTVDIYGKFIPVADYALVSLLDKPRERWAVVDDSLTNSAMKNPEKSGKPESEAVESNEISRT